MNIAVSCSWCHTENTLVIGVRNLCRHCGHRADLCRLDCDCFACVGIFSPAKEPITDEQLAEAIREAAAKWKGGGK